MLQDETINIIVSPFQLKELTFPHKNLHFLLNWLAVNMPIIYRTTKHLAADRAQAPDHKVASMDKKSFYRNGMNGGKTDKSNLHIIPSSEVVNTEMLKIAVDG